MTDAATALPVFNQAPSDPAFYLDPYPAYDRIRALGPFVHWSDYGLPVTARYETISAILRDRRFGREVTHVKSRAELGWPEIPDHLKPFYAFERNSLIEREPPVHTRLRGLVNRAFVSRAVERLRPQIEDLCDKLIDGFIGEGRADLLPAYATPLPVTVIAELLGLPASDAPLLLEWSHRMVAIYQFNRTRATEDATVAATEAFSDYVRGHIAAKRRAPADDLISLLIAARDNDDRLDEPELVATIILLMNAGHEATVHAIANGIFCVLATHDAGGGPSALAGSLDEPGQAEALVEETLRFDPPLHLFTRYALEDVEMGSLSLRCGDQVGLLLAAGNRDPAAFARPDRFDPGRYSTEPSAPVPLSFGAGLHFCVGAALARLEIQLALRVLFRRLPSLRLAERPGYRDSFHFHGLDRLPVRW